MTSVVSVLPRALPYPPRLPAGDRPLSLADLSALVRSVATDPALWQPRVQIPDGGADRWWTRLSSDPRVDVWLLSWLPGHATDLHDHGGSAAAFSVVRGRLAEVRVGARGRPVTHQRVPGSVTWLAPGLVHDVRGAGDRAAVSIHAYSPPLSEMNYHAWDGHGRLRRTHTVRSVEPERSGE